MGDDNSTTTIEEEIKKEGTFWKSVWKDSKEHHKRIATILLSLYDEEKFNEFECHLRKRITQYYNARIEETTDHDKSTGNYFEDLMYAIFHARYAAKVKVNAQASFKIIKTDPKSGNRKLSKKKLDIGISLIGIELKSAFSSDILEACFKEYKNLKAANGEDFKYICIGGGLYSNSNIKLSQELKKSQEDGQWLFCLPNIEVPKEYQLPADFDDNFKLRHCFERIDSIVNPVREEKSD